MDARDERPEEQTGRKEEHAEEPEDRVGSSPEHPDETYDWLAWNLFFQQIYGPEQVGYEVDEDGWPLDGEPWGGVEE